MYRVFDKFEQKWIKENVYLAPNDDLFISKKALFGTEKLSLVSSERYIYQKDTGLSDCNNKLIYEGDICKFEQSEIVGLVAFSPEHASYYLFDYDNFKYYVLNLESCKQVKVVGNIFENRDLMPSL